MRDEKKYLLDEVKDNLDKSPSFLVMRYKDMSCEMNEQLRTQIAEKGGSVEVTKKRICQKAFNDLGIEIEIAKFSGHIALILTGSADPFSVTKAAFSYKKDNDKIIDILAGRIDGEVVDGPQVKMLSELPSKDEMRAQLLSVFEAPLSGTLAVMESALTSVVYCLDNKVKQEESK